MDSSRHLFEEEKVGKAMIKLAIPAVLVQVITLVQEMIHSLYIAQLNNTAMLSSTSLSTTLVLIIITVGESVGIGAASYLGREMGAGHEDRSTDIVATALTLDFIITAVLTVGCLIIVRPFMIWQSNNNADVLQYAIPYGTLMIITSFLPVIYTTLIAMFRSVGDVRFPVYAIGVSVVAMIVLDPVFMFWMNMGIIGAAVSSAIANLLTFLMCMYRLLSGASGLQWKLLDLRIDRDITWAILQVGSSVYIRNFMSSFAGTVYNRQVFQYGTDFAAGCNVGKTAVYFVNFFILGVCNGYLPLASYNYGAKNYQRMYDAIAWNLMVQTGYCALAVLLIAFKAEAFIGLFTKSSEAIMFGARYIRAYNWSLLTYSVYNIITTTLQAAGKGKQSMVLSISRQGLIYAPLLIILPKLFDLEGIFMSQPVADWITVLVGMVLSIPLIREIMNGRKTSEA